MAAKLSSPVVCIGCGRKDTWHPSKLCVLCGCQHTKNTNEQSARDRIGLDGEPIVSRRIDPDTGKESTRTSGYRNLPGPPPDEEDSW